MDTAPLLLAGLIVLGYLLGSIASAIVVCRVLRRPDPRTGGSRNPGTTNVLRVAGRDAAALTLAGDMLKGLAAVAVARALTPEPAAWALAGAAAFFGHLYPVFFAFRGGKGVATALGALLGATPWAGLMAVATWLVVVAVARVSSVAALVTFALAPAYVGWVTRMPALVAVAAVVSLALFWRHRGNVLRLLGKA
ncbi:MAG: glycerol-3-phosphate 1-O-acyltransferase PlsY [Halofilum sp. (in: g-proteobacteria)]|nr:glycerol-3-phosphate 1-O-acyltransferase PlsY [Halofilum sp. (in: g-proteobacteria)]